VVNLYDALDKGLNKTGFVKHNLIKICLAILAVALLFSTFSCTTAVNRQPIITSLEAEAEWTDPLSSLQVTCTASDPDGDELSYEWTATGGDISGKGYEIIWTAPQPPEVIFLARGTKLSGLLPKKLVFTTSQLWLTMVMMAKIWDF